MKNQETQQDTGTQLALLSQKVDMLVEQLVKLEAKFDSIMDKYETKFATKEELQEVKDDIKSLQENGGKYIFWGLSLAVGTLISIVINFIK